MGDRARKDLAASHEVVSSRIDRRFADAHASYVGADDETLRAISDGWLRTGDLGHFDDSGYLYVTGRIKDVIIRGGENLSPLLIESVIVSDARVAACCVVGRENRDLGEVPRSTASEASSFGWPLFDVP